MHDDNDDNDYNNEDVNNSNNDVNNSHNNNNYNTTVIQCVQVFSVFFEGIQLQSTNTKQNRKERVNSINQQQKRNDNEKRKEKPENITLQLIKREQLVKVSYVFIAILRVVFEGERSESDFSGTNPFTVLQH